MAWTTPLTATSNTALTAGQWNASVRDNMLITPAGLASVSGSHFAGTGANSISERILQATSQTGAAETTTSTTYTGTLSGGAGTAGPSITAATGTKAIISFHCRQSTSVATTNVWTAVGVSGTTTIAASDNWAVSMDILNAQIYHGLSYIEPNLTQGASNTFQVQYRVSGGTGTFAARRLNVVPF